MGSIKLSVKQFKTSSYESFRFLITFIEHISYEIGAVHYKLKALLNKYNKYQILKVSLRIKIE
jgi:hypothetical protein